MDRLPLGLVLARHAALHPDKYPLSWGALVHGPGLRRLFALNRDLLLRTLSLVAAYAWFTRAGAREGDVVLAANAVLMNMNYIAAYGLDGFANATEALVASPSGRVASTTTVQCCELRRCGRFWSPGRDRLCTWSRAPGWWGYSPM